jgi:plasmid stabilization system protein ParE
MTHRVRFTKEAEADVVRLYEFILARDDGDWSLAEKALEAIKSALQSLAFSPFSCRKAVASSPFLRELVIPFGATGYVALFEIDGTEWITVLAIRHQREDDYHL